MFQRRVCLFIVIPLAVVFLVLSGCQTFHSPKVLDKGEQSFTIGIGGGLYNPYIVPGEGVFEGLAWFDIHALYRVHVVERVDVGVQLAYNGWSGLAVADAKYQILTEPFYLAASIGGGIHTRGDSLSDFSPVIQGLLIGGTDSFHIGVKPVYVIVPGPVEQEFPLAGGVFGGVVVGRRKRIVLEANAGYWNAAAEPPSPPAHSVVLTIGAGMRFVF